MNQPDNKELERRVIELEENIDDAIQEKINHLRKRNKKLRKKSNSSRNRLDYILATFLIGAAVFTGSIFAYNTSRKEKPPFSSKEALRVLNGLSSLTGDLEKEEYEKVYSDILKEVNGHQKPQMDPELEKFLITPWQKPNLEEEVNRPLIRINVSNPKVTSTWNIPQSIFNKYQKKYREDKGNDTFLYTYITPPGTNQKILPDILRTARAKKSRWKQYLMLNATVVDCTTNQPLSNVEVRGRGLSTQTNRKGTASQKIYSGVNNFLTFSKSGYTTITRDIGAGDWSVRMAPIDLKNKDKKTYSNPWLRKLQADFFKGLYIIGDGQWTFTGMWSKTKDRGDVYLASHSNNGININSPNVPKQLYLDFVLDCLRANSNGGITGKSHAFEGKINNSLELRIVNDKYIQMQAIGGGINESQSTTIYYPKSILNGR